VLFVDHSIGSEVTGLEKEELKVSAKNSFKWLFLKTNFFFVFEMLLVT
jgi:hypothetical protein